VFLLGRNQAKVDLPLLHDSISREHAAIIFDEHLGAQIIDLGSTTGTLLNGSKLNENLPNELKDNSEI
jgi:pSer/pThr/pTyr-binding forkhead associated (FHA) protein